MVNESFASAQDEDDRNTDAAVAPGDLSPLPCPVGCSAPSAPPHEVQDTGDNKKMMRAPSVKALSARVDVCGALTRADSLVKASKTKNASKMNKERTLLAGAIIELLSNTNSSYVHDAHAADGGDQQEHGQTSAQREERQEGEEEASQEVPCKEEGKEEGKEGSHRREGGSWRQEGQA